MVALAILLGMPGTQAIHALTVIRVFPTLGTEVIRRPRTSPGKHLHLPAVAVVAADTATVDTLRRTATTFTAWQTTRAMAATSAPIRIQIPMPRIQVTWQAQVHNSATMLISVIGPYRTADVAHVICAVEWLGLLLLRATSLFRLHSLQLPTQVC